LVGSLSVFDRLADADDEEVPPEAVTARTQQWVALCGLVYRLLAAPVPLIGFVGEVGFTAPVGAIAVAMAAVLAVNVALLREVMVRRSASFLHGSGIRSVDWVVAAGLNLWASTVIAPGSLDDAFHDVFWFYALGTVALWGGLDGLRTGVVLIVSSVALQVGMNRLNGQSLAEVNFVHVVARAGWIILIMVSVLMVASLLRLAARSALAAGHRAGRQAEQLKILRSMHDTVLQTLEAIALQARQRPCSEQRMREIEAAARRQAAELRVLLQSRPRPAVPPDPATGRPPLRDKGLVAALQQVVEQAASWGLKVELVTAEVDTEPAPVARSALAEAVGESLTNVAKHAGVPRAVVRAVSTPDRVEVTVRDHGHGFDLGTVRHGFGIAESITGRMREVGGDAEVSSHPGHGTRVRLWAPL
jgi:signal transduction histidine kinase